MVSKQFIILVTLVLGFLVIQDAYQIYTLISKSQLKLDYLHHSSVTGNSADLVAFKEFICFSSQQKRSYAKYCERMEDLNLETFQDSIKWEKYIDQEDLFEFTKNINEFPVIQKDKDLQILRNKKICSVLLLYLSGKVSVLDCGFGSGPKVYKDVFNNVSLFDFEPSLQKVYYNGHNVSEESWPVVIPKCDSLKIDYESLGNGRKSYRQFNSSYTIDLRNLSKI